MFFASSEISQDEVKSLSLREPFCIFLTPCFFVTVALLSTWTSLISNLAEWLLCGSTTGWIEGGEVENGNLSLGDEAD